MSRNIRYKTKQGEEILECLRSMKGTHITACDVCTQLKLKGSTVGAATVYRHLEKLVEHGVVRRFVTDRNMSACFEYIGDDEQCSNNCFHCICEDCGSLIHINCDDLLEVSGHIETNHGFKIDASRTVFYGICDKCQKDRE